MNTSRVFAKINQLILFSLEIRLLDTNRKRYFKLSHIFTDGTQIVENVSDLSITEFVEKSLFCIF